VVDETAGDEEVVAPPARPKSTTDVPSAWRASRVSSRRLHLPSALGCVPVVAVARVFGLALPSANLVPWGTNTAAR
jgi:hypothetical protein